MITPPPDPNWQPVVSWYMFEKIALVSMVTTIFALVVPDNTVCFGGVVVPVAFVIVVNAFASTWFTRRGQDWESIGKRVRRDGGGECCDRTGLHRAASSVG